MQENNNFESIIRTWRRLSGEQIETAVVSTVVSMSGDSPDFQPHKKKEEETDLLMPERTKAPITSIAPVSILAAADGPTDSTATENSEEKQEFIRHDKKDEDKDAAGDTNNKDCKSDKSADDYLENDKVTNKSEKHDNESEKYGDRVDSVYLRAPPAHKARSTTSTVEEENCGMKCLYYTIQCCDCVLM